MSLLLTLACVSGTESNLGARDGSSQAGKSNASGGTNGKAGAASGGTGASGGGSSGTGEGDAGGASGGSSPGSGGGAGVNGCGAYDRTEPIGAWEPKPSDCGPNCVRVRNYCPFPLWIKTGVAPDNQKLDPGGVINVATPAEWVSKRVTAFKGGAEGAGGIDIEKVEMNFSKGTVGYNLTYVDWVGLPSEVQGFGGNCQPNQHTTGCYVPQHEVLNGCPEEDLKSGDKCMAPRSFCIDGNNHGRELCQRLDSAITECNQKGLGCPPLSGDPNVTGTPAVYGCNSETEYGNNAVLCAALNRGMLDDQDSKDRSSYFKNPPYNTYSAWMQCLCPGIYTFPYDDVHEQGGFRSCAGDELRITWCPGDTPP